MQRIAFGILFLSVVLVGAEDAVLNHATIDAWRARIAPSERELFAETLPWKTTLLDGVKAAAAADKPLFLWVMNGHPLGCT